MNILCKVRGFMGVIRKREIYVSMRETFLKGRLVQKREGLTCTQCYSLIQSHAWKPIHIPNYKVIHLSGNQLYGWSAWER